MPVWGEETADSVNTAAAAQLRAAASAAAEAIAAAAVDASYACTPQIKIIRKPGKPPVDDGGCINKIACN